MALPDAGNPISLQQVNVELGLTATASINMGGSNVRTLFDDASGAISMSDGYGKSNEIGLTASAAASANLQSLFDANTSGSWAGDIAKVYTINSGTTMGILTAPASMGGTLVLNNSGNIQGVGGTANGGAGGTAMTVQSTGITINMLSGSTLSGGGGAGGGGGQGGIGEFLGGGNLQYAPGGAGGAGGRGIGYNQAQANGSGGSGSNHSNGGGGGTGGNGSNSFGGAGAAGNSGGGGNKSGGASGGAAGGAGRAVTFSGVSAYTIIGTNSGTINGAYT
jgi:hypothetical protein